MLQNSGKNLCGMSLKGVHTNFILIGGCFSWVHKKCSGIPGLLKPDLSFRCERRTGETRTINVSPVTEVTLGREKLEVMQSRCYIGDCLYSVGSYELASITRYHIAWHKFNELLSILTSHSLPITSRGRVYNSCTRSAMQMKPGPQPYLICTACNAMAKL